VNEPFVSLDGRFSVALPKSTQGFAPLSPKQTRTTSTGQQFTWKFAEAEVVGFYLDNPDSALTGSAAELARIAEQVKARMAAKFPNGKVVSEGRAASDSLPYYFFVYDAGPAGFISTHLFLSGKRVYQFSAGFRDRSVEDRFSRAVATFRLISQADVDEAIKRKYEEMKPPPLPQSPVVQRLTTDAQDAGLKGKIKKVVTETEDSSGTWSVQGRKPSSVSYYDENGSLTQRDAYDSQGHPFQVTVYGYIDGKRVSNSKITTYEYDPPPMMAPRSSSSEPEQKRDPRYEYSFEYKYEAGKLIERQMIYNNGKKGMRYVYKNSPNQVEELVYTEEGKLNQRYLSILDSGGNEIEETNFAVVNFDIYGDRRYKYAYEFDSKGNWIRKVGSKEVKENGTTRWEPSSITYRTITYY
jgi:hypothetical protein